MLLPSLWKSGAVQREITEPGLLAQARFEAGTVTVDGSRLTWVAEVEAEEKEEPTPPPAPRSWSRQTTEQLTAAHRRLSPEQLAELRQTGVVPPALQQEQTEGVRSEEASLVAQLAVLPPREAPSGVWCDPILKTMDFTLN